MWSLACRFEFATSNTVVLNRMCFMVTIISGNIFFLSYTSFEGKQKHLIGSRCISFLKYGFSNAN